MSLEHQKAIFAQLASEASVLACVLHDPLLFFDVEAKLDDNDFLGPQNKAIWTVIKNLRRAETPVVDIASLLTQAQSLKLDDKIGGYEYVNSLFEKIVNPANLKLYLDKVADASTKYKIVCTTSEISELAESNKTLTGETLTADSIVSYAQDKFLQISIDSQKNSDALNLADGLRELIAEATAAPSSVKGLATGFKRLDERINGLEPGSLTVIGARPKTGKSAFLLNIAKHISFDQGVPSLILDTEMATREQQFRTLAILSGVPERQIKNGTYTSDPDWTRRVDEAVEIIERGLIIHKYYPDFTPEGVAALTRKYKYQYNIGCLIFDYIKLPDADLQVIGNVKEYQALGYLCVALKNLAGQLQIPVITAAQIGRTGASKGRVTAADFADSDRILRYANTLLGLSFKTKDEIQKLMEDHGKERALQMGSHRLQILETRGGGTHHAGLDIHFRKDIIRMEEADVQLYEIMSTEDEEEGKWT